MLGSCLSMTHTEILYFSKLKNWCYLKQSKNIQLLSTSIIFLLTISSFSIYARLIDYGKWLTHSVNGTQLENVYIYADRWNTWIMMSQTYTQAAWTAVMINSNKIHYIFLHVCESTCVYVCISIRLIDTLKYVITLLDLSSNFKYLKTFFNTKEKAMTHGWRSLIQLQWQNCSEL